MTRPPTLRAWPCTSTSSATASCSRTSSAAISRRSTAARCSGSLWSLVNPLALMAVYLRRLRPALAGTNIPYYPLYLLAGIACWIFFARRCDRRAVARRQRRPREEGALPAAARAVLRRRHAARHVRGDARDPDRAVARVRAGARARRRALDPARGCCSSASWRAGADRGVAERRVPRRRAHPRRGAAAVVLPHADPLELRRAAGRAEPRHAAEGARVGEHRRAADHAVRDTLWLGAPARRPT